MIVSFIWKNQNLHTLDSIVVIKNYFLKNDDAVTHIFFMISDCSIVLNT